MFCNFDCVANPNPLIVDRSRFVRGNTHSNHKLGYESKRVLTESTAQIKSSFVHYENIEFIPGGGTMANKRAIFGSIPWTPKRLSKDIFRDKILISAIEHKSINENVIQQLVNRGYDVIKLPVDREGRIIIEDMVKVLHQNKEQVALVSILNVNNETGIKQDIVAICEAIKNVNKNILLHTDISASVVSGRNYSKQSIYPDLMTFSVYKLGGPHLGVVLSRIELNDEYYGTQDIENIQYATLAIDDYLSKKDNILVENRISKVKNKLKEAVKNLSVSLDMDIKDLSGENSVSNIQSFLLPDGYEAKIIQSRLSDANIYIGTGSACSNQTSKGSHVVEAMGYLATFGLLRFSYDQTLSTDDVDLAISQLEIVLRDLKSIKDMEETNGDRNTTTARIRNQARRINQQYQNKYVDKEPVVIGDIPIPNEIQNQTDANSISNHTSIQSNSANIIDQQIESQQSSIDAPIPTLSSNSQPFNVTPGHSKMGSKPLIVVVKKDSKFDSKEFKRIDLPLDLPSTHPAFDSIKLTTAELYLKGGNKKIYFKALVNTIKNLGYKAVDMILKENLIIIKNNRHSINHYLRIAGLARVIPCTILYRRNFIKVGIPNTPLDPNLPEADTKVADNIDPIESKETLATPELESGPSKTNPDIESQINTPQIDQTNPSNPSPLNTNTTKPKTGNSRQKYSKNKGDDRYHNTNNNNKRGVKKKTMDPQEKALKDFYNDDYLKSVLSIIVGMVEDELATKETIRFRLTAHFVLLRVYFDLSRQDFERQVGQYIRDRFNVDNKNRVIVDLKNYDIDININVYDDMIILSSKAYTGVGGLPEGTSTSGLMIIDESLMNDANYRDRVQVSSLMAAARGSSVFTCTYQNLNEKMISKSGYFIVEPNQYNQQGIYSYFKHIESSFQKPIFSLTNLMTDEEIKEKKSLFNIEESSLVPNQIILPIDETPDISSEATNSNPIASCAFNTLTCTTPSNQLIDNEPRNNIQPEIESSAHAEPSIDTQAILNLKDKIAQLSLTPIKRVLMLLSGGIDSPVASYLLLRAGYHVDYIHFASDIDKVDNIITLRNILGKESKIYVVSFSPLQQEIVKTCMDSYRTLMYKVFMVKIANNLSKLHGYDALACGNALGQVASQTPENIKATHLISPLPIITPLFGYNKDHIIKISTSIGTYGPSTIAGTNDCCVMYMPKNPKTRANYGLVLNYISKIPVPFVDEVPITTV